MGGARLPGYLWKFRTLSMVLWYILYDGYTTIDILSVSYYTMGPGSLCGAEDGLELCGTSTTTVDEEPDSSNTPIGMDFNTTRYTLWMEEVSH